MRGLFIGNESFTWKPADFTTAANRVKPFGIDTLFIKVADGTNLWYGGYSGIAACLRAVTDTGLAVIPFTFSYANTLGGYTGEVAIVNTLQSMGYTVCMDMESAWNGNTGAAKSLVNDLKKPVYISTWGDPHEQQWDALLPILLPKCIAFLPQVYTSFLAGAWQAEYQAAKIPPASIIPTFNAVTILGALHVPSWVFWEYADTVDALFTQLIGELNPVVPLPTPTPAPVPVPKPVLSSSGEVATFTDNNSQFEAGESAYACVAFGCATIYYSGPPGGVPTGSAEDIDVLADQWYTKETGSITSTSGLSVPQEYAILNGMGLHFIGLPVTANTAHDSDIANVKAWLAKGIPVLICGLETNFRDVGLGNIVPYTWTPSGSHAIVASGITPSGNLYVRDYANVGHGLVPGSRREYSIAAMDLISATAVYPRWLKGAGMNTVPHNWTDDGTTLRATNGPKGADGKPYPVVQGFRGYILGHAWDSNDVPMNAESGASPLEKSNPMLGTKAVVSGTTQTFALTRLAWRKDTNSVYVSYIGQELVFVEQLLSESASALALAVEAVAQAEAEIAALEKSAATAPLPAPVPVIPPVGGTVITTPPVANVYQTAILDIAAITAKVLGV